MFFACLATLPIWLAMLLLPLGVIAELWGLQLKIALFGALIAAFSAGGLVCQKLIQTHLSPAGR